MKLYAFYYKTDDINKIPSSLSIKASGVLINRGSVLYAITKSKEYRDIFIKQRNMDLFDMKTIVVDDEIEMDKLYDEFEYGVLEMNPFTTISSVKNKVRKSEQVMMLTTSDEYEYIMSVGLSDAIIKITQYIHSVYKTFNKPLRKALFKTLKCDSFKDIDRVIDQYEYESLDIDEFGIFCMMYGYMLRK